MKVWTVYNDLSEDVLAVFSTKEAADSFVEFYVPLWDVCPSRMDVEEWELDADLREVYRKAKVRYDYSVSPEGMRENKRVMDELLKKLDERI